MHGLCCKGHTPEKCRCRVAPQLGSPGLAFAPARVLSVIALLFTLVSAGAQTASPSLTLAQLRNDPNLTPERFGQYFRDFEFKLGGLRQAPETFLASKAGDCDDFACLAAEVLREKRYTTKLVAVFMTGETHVVCYVEEIHGYLDYNLRKEASAIQLASGKLEDIADKVAAYFRTPWRSASELNYEADQPRFGRMAFAKARSGSKPERPPNPSPRQTASIAASAPTMAAVTVPRL
jgi:hypothetical protein